MALLRSRFEVDLSHYKPTTVRRRVERRAAMGRFDDLGAYAEHLRSHAEELEALHGDLFIHVTGFFRDPESFQALRKRVLPALLKKRDPDEPLRVWVPGCSTGEEAYSLGMVFTEALEAKSRPRPRVQIFATDISEAAVAQARRALFSEAALAAVSPARVARFFEKHPEGYRVSKQLRELLVVSRHDLGRNPPFARLDLISCRNVLIYFGPQLQERVLPLFHYALKPGGYLWLGRSESPGATSKLFTLIDKSHRIYARAELSQRDLGEGPLGRGRLTLPRELPPFVLPAPGAPPLPPRPPRPPRPARPPGPGGRASAPEVATLRRQLEAVLRRERELSEQFEAAQEELTTANEELQATNEEFQSTNEELETAQEELQSANEELTSLNDELQARNAELVALNEKLVRGENRFRLMVEGVRDYAIYLLDPEGRVSSWNEGARRLKGFEASEILGQSYARFFPPEDLEAGLPEHELERARIDGRHEDTGWRLRKDGGRFWAHVVVTRINDAQGALVGFSKVTRDLTEKKLADDALQAANGLLELRVKERTAELARALKARDEFLSIASHELKTPLTALKLKLQLAQRSARAERGSAANSPAAKDADAAWSVALRQVSTLEDLIEDLLDVSRIQTGQLTLELAHLDASALVREVAARFSELAGQAQTRLELSLQPGVSAWWDGRRVGQVLSNLLSNALKYAPHSPVKVSLSAEGRDRATLVVEDGGPGILPERQASLFERFERAGASPSVGGLGLGLFIARRIVEAHGGTIAVHSRPGHGAAFTVRLPLAPNSPTLTKPPEEP